jgi:hypothetical protein
VTFHAVHIDIDVRTNGDQITGHARVGLSQPEPFLGWLGFILGDAFGQMAANQVANLAERRIRTVMFACTRPF